LSRETLHYVHLVGPGHVDDDGRLGRELGDVCVGDDRVVEPEVLAELDLLFPGEVSPTTLIV